MKSRWETPFTGELIPLKASMQKGSPNQIEVLPQPIRQAEIVSPSSESTECFLENLVDYICSNTIIKV